MSLEKNIADRKERLRALTERSKTEGSKDRSNDAKKASSNVEKQVNWRNYDPESEAPKSGFLNAPSQEETVESQAKEIIAKIQDKNDEIIGRQSLSGEDAVDLFALRPQKPDIDLQNLLLEKLERLEEETNRAKVKVIREKLSTNPRSY